jgi:cytochrome b involved in lipid metabolism
MRKEMKALQFVMSKMFAVLILVSVQNLVFLQSSQASISSEVDSQESSLEFASAYKAANETTYTLTDVAKHSSRTDCWTIVNEVVYNITPYVNSHPGGSSSISKICGVNGTAIFNNIHGGSATQANILANYKIGVLAKPISRTCTAGNFFSTSLSKCTPAPKGFFVSATSSAAGVTSATACPAGKFSSGTGSVECQTAPKGFFVSTSASSSATQCSAGFTTLATGSTMASDCYKPIAQTIPGFSSPKAMKYKGTVNLPITTNGKAIAGFKFSGPCTAKVTTVITKKNGQTVSNKMLKVTAASQSGQCKIALTSPGIGKYLGLTKSALIKISKTGH